MAQINSTHDFDTVIVGGGLSGLLLAKQALGLHKKVALIEATDELGGSSRPFVTSFGEIDYELKFLPNSPAGIEALAWLETCLAEPVGARVSELIPETFESGKLKPFIGFGVNTAKSCDEINYYASPSHFQFEKSPKDWIKILKSQLVDHKLIKIFNKSKVTSLLTQNHQVIGAVLNAHQSLSAKEFIWAAPIQTLAEQMNEQNLPLRQKQRLAKTRFFASIHLDLLFSKKIYDQNNILLLQGANEEPLVGRFTSLGDGQLSQWICLIPNQDADSEESVASILKYMKRQISRAFEASMDFKIYERITLNNLTHGKISLDRDDSKFGKFENLWVSQAALSPSGNLLGCLEQTQKAWQNFSKTQVFTRSEEAAQPELSF